MTESSSRLFTEDLLAQIGGSIAVVGNGELTYDFGSFIDRHDFVIRFNAFALRGYEARCGCRTTHWCTFGETPYQPMSREDRDGLRPLSPFTADAAESTDVSPEFSSRLVYAEHDYRTSLFPRPSTGILLLRILESLRLEADVFGFDGFISGHYYGSGHEHDPNHSSAEFIYLLTRPCFNVYLDDLRPLPTLQEDPFTLLSEATVGSHRIV